MVFIMWNSPKDAIPEGDIRHIRQEQFNVLESESPKAV
jgi:hypothetical protein